MEEGWKTAEHCGFRNTPTVLKVFSGRRKKKKSVCQFSETMVKKYTFLFII